MKKAKAILIDVVAQSLSVVEIESLQSIYNHIGNGCNLFQVPIEFDNSDCIYVDEEGLLKDVHGGFIMKDWSYPLIGNALIVGSDEEGDSVDFKSDLEELKKQIHFVDKNKALAWQNKALSTHPVIISF